jgi:hypothetical protein
VQERLKYTGCALALFFRFGRVLFIDSHDKNVINYYLSGDNLLKNILISQKGA